MSRCQRRVDGGKNECRAHLLPQLVLKVLPCLERDGSGVEGSLVVYDQALALLSDNLASRSPANDGLARGAEGRGGRGNAPREVVHLPETDDGEDEGEEWNGENVEDHPS